MTELRQKYRCNICGNEVVVTHTGAGKPVCCGQEMSVIDTGYKCGK